MYGTNLQLGTTTRGLEIAAPVTLSIADRRRHVLVIGKTGVGKSTLLKTMMLADLEAGRGFTLIDPHGDLADAIADAVPPWRTEAILIDPSDLSHSVGFNPLAQVRPDARPLVAAHLLAAFAHIWDLSLATTPRLIRLLNAALRIMLDTPGVTLVQLPRVFSDEKFRSHLVAQCNDPIVRSFWLDEFAHYNDRFEVEAVDPLLNKAGVLLAEPAIRYMVAQPKSTIDIRGIMDENRILIVNLSKGRLGEGPAHLIGALLVTGFSQAAESRATIPEEYRQDHFLYVDEFQNFATDSFARVLSEARKYRLGLVLSHQHTQQLTETLRHSVFGNAGSIVAFRVGADDAERLARELQIAPSALLDLPNFKARAQMLKDGCPVDTVYLDCANTAPHHDGRIAAVRARTRSRHARPRAIVEAMIESQLSSR